LRGEVAVHDGMERGFATLRLAKDGHPSRIDKVELRQVMERRVGIKRLIGKFFVATVGDAADPRATARVTYPQELSRSAITAEFPNMPLQPCNTTTAGYGAPSEWPPISADKPASGRAR